MVQISEADRFLIEKIRRGESDGWNQLVARYQGRLQAFARSHLARKSEAEDLVQDTFVLFLQSLKSFNDQASLETYLFTILRRKVIDLYRGRQLRACLISELNAQADDSSDIQASVPSPQPAASWYVRRDEQADRARAILASALSQFIGRLKDSHNFRDLKIMEMLLYAQMRNNAAGQTLGLDEKQIALIKHRMIRSLQEKLPKEAPEPTDSLLTEVWEEHRFTCPKRSTIGRFLLGTLEEPWREYVDFHLHKLGCRFCQANVDDLQKADEAQQMQTQQRIYESTIGFFKR